MIKKYYQIKQIELGTMQNYAYLISYNNHKAILIDPGWDYAKVIDILNNLELKAILLTHGHFDHCTAVPDLQQKFNVPVYISRFEPDLYRPKISLIDIDDEEELVFDNLIVKCLHTPGHTPGSQCFLIDHNLFTGDTLFLDGCGRWDLPFSSKSDIKDSIQKLKTLSDETIIYPGHNYHELASDNLRHQKIVNPCFQENF